MISKFAVQKFLETPTSNLDLLKDFPEEELDRLLADYGVDFHTVPRKHQKVATLIGITYPGTLFLMGMGTGKTKIILDIFYFRKMMGEARRLLLIVPNNVNIESTRDEIRFHRPEVSFIGLEGDAEDRAAIIEDSEEDIVIATYKGLLYALGEKVEFEVKKVPLEKGLPETDKKKEKEVLLEKGLQLIDKKVTAFARKFQMLVMDESSNLKNHMSLSYKLCKKLSQTIHIRFELTGTPFGRDVENLWSQFYIIDGGLSLGPTLGLFRECFFTKKKAYWTMYEYVFDKKTLPILRDRMKNCALHYEVDECMDLPELVEIRVPINLSPELRQSYEDLRKAFAASRGDNTQMNNAFIKMRQFTSGIVSAGGATAVIEDNLKTVACLELVEEIPQEEKIVIFNEFILSGDYLEKQLKKRKYKVARIYGGSKDSGAELQKFLKDPKYRIMLVNNQAGAFGLNLQKAARYVIYFESSVSCIIRPQTEKRCHRLGQEKTVFMYDLFVKDSVDENILAYLKEGKDLYAEILKNPV